jgi:hypothetical protein
MGRREAKRQIAYSANVAYLQTSVTLTPVAAYTTATILVNDTLAVEACYKASRGGEGDNSAANACLNRGLSPVSPVSPGFMG